MTELLKHMHWERDAAVASHPCPNEHKYIYIKHFKRKISPVMKNFQGKERSTKQKQISLMLWTWCQVFAELANPALLLLSTVRCETESRWSNAFASPNQEHSSQVFQIKNNNNCYLGCSWNLLPENSDSLIRDFNIILLDILEIHVVNLIFFTVQIKCK